MVYIPDDWIKDKTNKSEIFNILNRLNKDVDFEDGYSVQEGLSALKDLGETIIVEKLSQGVFSFGG